MTLTLRAGSHELVQRTYKPLPARKREIPKDGGKVRVLSIPAIRDRVVGAADKAESPAGCKSPYRQLPVFGRLAYPERVEATKHDVPGCRSPSCPAGVVAA